MDKRINLRLNKEMFYFIETLFKHSLTKAYKFQRNLLKYRIENHLEDILTIKF